MKNIYSSHINGSKLTSKKKAVKGVVIHNDYGTLKPSQYLEWLYQRERDGSYVNGWAAIYADRNECLWYHPTDYVEWHCGNQWANENLVGIEVCQSHPAAKLTDAQFKENEEACFKIAADVLKSYNLPVNRDTVNLHREYFATACPHRSWDLHVGKNAPNTRSNQVKLLDYFIKRIQYYYTLNDSKKAAPPAKAPAKAPTATATKKHKVAAGESLWSIAQKYKVSVDDLKKWNKKDSNVIYVGQSLIVKK